MAIHKTTTETTVITLSASELLGIILTHHGISGGIADIEMDRDGSVTINHTIKKIP